MALLYTLEEAAGILGISPGELRAKAQAREVPAILANGTWKLRSTVVNDLVRHRGAPNRPAEPAPPAQSSGGGGGPVPTTVSAGASASRPTMPAVPTPAPAAPPFTAPNLTVNPAPVVPPPVSPAPPAVVSVKAVPVVLAAPPPPPPPPVAVKAAPPVSPAPPPAVALQASPDVRTSVVDLPATSGQATSEIRTESVFPVHLDPDAFEQLVQLPPGVHAQPAASDGPVREPDDHSQVPADTVPHLIDFSGFSGFDLPAFADAPHSAGDGETSATEAEPFEATDELEQAPELPAEKEPDPPRVVTCPNLACRSPGFVPASRLKRPMRCKVCGTDFYWDAASDAFVIGLHHEAVSTAGPQARPASSAPTTTTTAPYRYRRWTRQRISRWARAGVLVVLLGVVAFTALARLWVRPELPNQVQDRALFIGKALCRDDLSSIQAVVAPGTWSDAQRWFKEVRPPSWPASDAGVVVEPRLKFARVKSGAGECDLHIWPARGDSGVALGTSWIWSGDGRWQLDGTATLKFKSTPLAAYKPPTAPSRASATGSRPSGKRGGPAGKVPAAPLPQRVDDTP